jgi:hypothetical protein
MVAGGRLFYGLVSGHATLPFLLLIGLLKMKKNRNQSCLNFYDNKFYT